MKLFIITCLVAFSSLAIAQSTTPGTSASPSGAPAVAPSSTSPSGTSIDPMNQEDSTIKPAPSTQSEEARMKMEEQEEADDLDTDNASDMSTVPSSSPSSPSTVP